MRRGDPAVLVLLAAAATAGACAHDPAKPSADPYVANGVAAIDTWFDQLPGCPPTVALQPATYSPDATFVSVHGPLTLTTKPECTLRRCEDECCNNCTPTWVVVPDGGEGPTRELALQKSGQSRPMSASVRDCKLRTVREQIRKPQVVVSGWLENDPVQPKIVRASICVVKEAPSTAPAAP